MTAMTAEATRPAPRSRFGVRARPGALDWKDNAACRGVDQTTFYPVKGQSSDPARQICAGCTVRPECLEYALAGAEQYGIWGGTSLEERRKLRRRRSRGST